ncbi:hypothetical protein DACRYDRAFT_115612 [Dacryopinax primogenitus]|uniref:CHAT domain-containing protein n=1 Tax=Dacryopinax primogenitus (strain DJM 731) TaxID=1858805 RepID=M5G9L9_DACPD|nr:uncharacterized protein DACRYDRAFT_115612 [Dacryopinax primogenitus]EJU02562.1 hypothetical protein DACRYDRAFT_115612 [Dacryopinax primogenitus]
MVRSSAHNPTASTSACPPIALSGCGVGKTKSFSPTLRTRSRSPKFELSEPRPSKFTPPSYELYERELVLYDQLGGGSNLDHQIEELRRTVAEGHRAERGRTWEALLVLALVFRFDIQESAADLEEARAVAEAVVKCTELRTGAHTQALFVFGRVWEAAYRHWGSTDVLERAYKCVVDARANADSDCSGDSARYSDGLDLLTGWLLTYHIPVIRAGGDLSEAITLVSAGVDRLGEKDPWKALGLGILSRAYRWQWHLTGCSDWTYLYKSDELVRQALEIRPNNRRRHCLLHMLASTCQDRFDGGEGVQYLHEALAAAQESVRQAREIRPNVTRFEDRNVIQSLAMAYFTLSRVEGRLKDLDKAIAYQTLISETSGPDEPPSFFLNLCVFLSFRFRMAGRLIDIDNAIEAGHRALERTRPDSLQTELTLSTLGNAHALRFVHGGDQADFDAAYKYLDQAATRVRANKCTLALLPCITRALAAIYDVQFETHARLEDIDFSVRYQTECVSGAGENYEKPNFYSELGGYLSKRYEAGKDETDLDEAIINHEIALATVATGLTERHMILWRYGRSLAHRYQLHNEPSDFDKCAHIMKEAAIAARAAAHPKTSQYLADLASLFSMRYEAQGEKEDLDISLRYYAVSYAVPEGFIDNRFQSALAAARLAQDNNRPKDAVNAFSAAIGMLPRLAWLGLNSSRRHAKLINYASQLASDAAASAIQAGQLERAVELLEEGRSVLWRSMMELRTDFSSLENSAPGLARELVLVAQSLEYDGMSTAKLTERQLEERAQHRRRTAERWEFLIEQVRKVPEFEGFLKPLSFSELRKAAAEGPVVILNASKYRSDALIIHPQGMVRCISLEGLNIDTVKQLNFVFSKALRIPRDQNGCRFIEQLLRVVSSRLWYGGLSNVAEALASCAPPPSVSEELFRVWWMPTGLLSLLPVQCAGPYDSRTDQPGIADLFVSSFTTTLSSLLAARNSQASGSCDTPARMVAISQASTPGNAPLRAAGVEIEVLAQSRFSPGITFLREDTASVSSFTSALTSHNWVHCCCHGHWDSEHPLDSAFDLCDGRLMLHQIISLRLDQADFAFLSACHTARQSVSLPDESMHLAAGLQIAGFRGVLATAWAMADRDGPALAWHFYKALEGMGRGMDARCAARAMQSAVRELRREGMPMHRWAAFVHIGI